MSLSSHSPRNWSSSVKYGTTCAVVAALAVGASATIAAARDNANPPDRAPVTVNRAPVTVTRSIPSTGPCFMAPPSRNTAIDGPIPTCNR